MENEKQLQNENFDVQLTTAAVGFLKETAKWSKFLAIIGFVGIGLMVLVALFILVKLSDLNTIPAVSLMPFSMSVFSLIYFVFAALYFFPIYYLFQFSVKTSKALKSKNSQLLTDGLENLKSHYKFLGVFTLVIISLYALIFVFVITAGIFAALN